MPNLLVKFYIYLDHHADNRLSGPLFHRWLPNGRKDAITINTTINGAKLEIWFEQRGFVNDKFIEFDVTRKDLDPSIIPTQAALTAGPLFGAIEFQSITDKEAHCISSEITNDSSYIDICNKIVNKIICPNITQFIDTLRTKYGQYWIRENEALYDQKRSLQNQCQLLRLQASIDQGTTWFNLIPDKENFTYHVTAIFGSKKSFQQYLTEEDWKNLAILSQRQQKTPIGAYLVSAAHQLLEEEEYKYSLIEAVTALDLSLESYVDNNQKKLSTIDITAFNKKRLEERLKLVAPYIEFPKGTRKSKTVQQACQAIRIRNNTIHHFFRPDEQTKPRIMSLLIIATVLNFDSAFKLPSTRIGNSIRSIVDWDKEEL